MKFLIDPHSVHYDNNQLFNLNNKQLNRDDGLLPYARLKSRLEEKGFEVSTFDTALNSTVLESFSGAYYLSLGRVRDPALLTQLNLNLYGYVIMEPPLVNPTPYEQLPELTKSFKNVFVHNTQGDGFDLKNINLSSLKKLYWPQPYNYVIPKFWDNSQRKGELVMINGQHKPKRARDKELYSERIYWAVALNKFIPVSVFGRGWNKLLQPTSLWLPFLLNYMAIQKIYKGPCESKLEIMSQYDFALCFENLQMDGYITEKIFDCFYAGAIPVYWGPPNIHSLIPKNCYIDRRDFKTANELSGYLKNLSQDAKKEFRLNAKHFLESPTSSVYYDLYESLELNRIIQ